MKRSSQIPNRSLITKKNSTYILAILILIYITYFGFFQVSRHKAHWTFLDLAGIEQTVWNTIHGRPFAFTLFPATGKVVTDFESRVTVNFLGEHVQPILLILAIPYALFPHSETLLLSMCISVGLGAIPFYRIAQRRFHSNQFAVLLTSGYLFLPAIQTAIGWDPHGTSFVIPCILAALDAAESDKPGWWWLWSLLAMGTREDVPFVTGWAMVWMVPEKMRKQAIWILGIGIVWSMLNFFIIMPYFSEAPTPFLAFFSESGSEISNLNLIKKIIQPHFLISKFQRLLLYNLRLGLPLLFLYLFKPQAYIASLPLLVVNAVSANDAMVHPSLAHYSLPFISYLLVGSLDGMIWLRTRLHTIFPLLHWSGILRVSFLGTIFAVHLLEGYTPLNPFFVWPVKSGQEKYVKELLALIPENAPASMDMHIAAQDSQREILRIFPDIRDVEWVAMNVWYGGYPYGLQANMFTELFDNEDWRTAYAHQGLILLHKGEEPSRDFHNAFSIDSDPMLKTLSVFFSREDSGIELKGVDIVRLPLGNVYICTDWHRRVQSTALPYMGILNSKGEVQSVNLFTTLLFPELYGKVRNPFRDCTLVTIPATQITLPIVIRMVEDGESLPVLINNEVDIKGDIVVYNTEIEIGIDLRDY
ncbi:MAG: DUF2079 domain-containing protein [Bacteroidales bacterium]|nr:DUF2079 domain-containing protein [Bacteroidales bacterium]